MKKLPENAVYSDVVNSGLILIKKEKYTKSDFNRLVKIGWSQLDAQWIVVCSAAYHKAKLSKIFCTNAFLTACQYGIA